MIQKVKNVSRLFAQNLLGDSNAIFTAISGSTSYDIKEAMFIEHLSKHSKIDNKVEHTNVETFNESNIVEHTSLEPALKVDISESERDFCKTISIIAHKTKIEAPTASRVVGFDFWIENISRSKNA